MGIRRTLAAGAAATAVFVAGAALAAEVNIYSARQEYLIKPQLDAFAEQTGIEVNLVTGKADELVQRLKAEGRNSPADLFFTADAGNLGQAKQLGLFKPVRSAVLEAAIPPQYRDPAGYWFGLGVRARPIFYARDRVRPEALSSYEALTDPVWHDRIVVRSSSNIYNQSLLASMIHHHGAERAEAWAKGIVENMARRPQGGDRDQIKAVAAGEADVAIANTYYYALMLTSENAADREAAGKVALFWPNQGDRGVHVNISGVGVTAASRNTVEAVRLLEYLAGDAAQKIYAEVGQEFPVKPGVEASATVASFGEFKADDINLAILGELNAEAVRIFDRVGWR